MIYRLLGRLPLPVLYALARPCYLILYYVSRYRRAVVRDNLSQAFPEKGARELQELEKKYYRQLVDVAFEILRARYMDADDIRRRVRVVNAELVAMYSQGFTKPVMVLSLHQGNWEWMLHGVKLALDIPIDPVYQPLHNATLDGLMREIRSRFGARPVPVSAASRDVLRRRSEFRLLVLVADQAPVAGERSYWAEFLHREAPFQLGPEIISRTTGCPVLFARCRRRGRGRYEVEFREVARPPYGADDHRVTERYLQLLEEAIRSEPASWLWSNRRWKHRRPPQGTGST